MPQDTFNTFSFNNFKPYGEKMQTFSKKPITLIYGPNSVGKSSLLQAVMYSEYLKNLNLAEKNNPDVLNFIRSNFAGDELDLGGFTNYINNKNSEKSIIFSSTITKKEDFEKFFSSKYKMLREFNKEGVFEIIENIQNTDNKLSETIQNRLKNYQILPGCYPFSSAFKSIINLDIDESYTVEKAFIEYYNLQNNAHADEIFNTWLNSNDKYEDQIYRSDKQKLDVFDKYLLFAVDMMVRLPVFNNLKEIEKFDNEVCQYILNDAKFYKYIANINSVTLETEVKYDENKKLTLTNIMLIDDEVIFGINYTNNSFIPSGTLQLNHDSTFIQNSFEYFFINKPKGNLYFEFEFTDLLDSKNYTIFDKLLNNNSKDFFLNFLYHSFFKESSNLQYIGPLRYLPSRREYYKMTKSKHEGTNQENSSSFFLEYKKKILPLTNKYINKINKLNIKFLNSILKSKPVIYFVLGIISLITLPSIINNAKFDSILFLQIKNIFKSRHNKVSLNNASTSQKMWRDLLTSSELQEKVNVWLSDEKKLKTPYEIRPIEYENKPSLFKRIFTKHKEIYKEIIPEFVDIKKDTVVSIKDMGLGISQVLPVIISTIATKNTKIFLEQPELHLHPAVQAELADEFIRSSKASENNNEFMIETHSEHLLLRIMKRMRHTAEGKIAKDNLLALTPNDVCLLYVDSDGANTCFNELELDEDGTLLDPWPNGFFEEGHKERFD